MSASTDLGAFAFEGVLFDLDGTLVNSANAVRRFWHKVAEDLNIDPQTIIKDARGRRSIDTIGLHDPSKATWEYVTGLESSIPQDLGWDSHEVPGATSLLQLLKRSGMPLAIVTSCTRGLLLSWVDKLALPEPDHTVTAEDVEAGKPDPACYILARERIGKGERAAPILVVEDSPTGVLAGKASGCRVLGVTTNVKAEVLTQAGADWIVPDFTSFLVERAKPSENSNSKRWRLIV